MKRIEGLLVWLCSGAALVIFLVGVVDLASPLLSARLYAVVLVLTAVLVFAGTTALTRGWTRGEEGSRWRLGEPLLLVGMALTTVHAVGFLALWQHESLQGTRTESATGALVVAGIGVAAVWWFRAARHHAWEGLANVGRTVGSIGVTAGVVSTVAFNLYDTQPHAGGVGPGLTITPSATLLGEQEGYHVVQVTAAMKNVGKSTVQTVGSLYVARAVDVGRRDAPDDEFFGRFPPVHRATERLVLDGSAARYGSDESTKLAGFGTVVPTGSYLEPDQETVRSFTLRVPSKGFDAVRLVVSVGVGDSDRLRLLGPGQGRRAGYEVDSKSTRVSGTAELTRIVWPMEEATALRWLRRSPRMAVVDVVERVRPKSDDPEQVARAAAYGPALFPCVALERFATCAPHLTMRRLTKEYGLAVTQAQIDVPLLPSSAD